MKPIRLAAALSSLALAAVLACAPASTTSTAPAGTAASVASGIDLDGMDKAVAPGDDFFRYANGTWLKTAEIPADRSSWGASSVLEELTAKRVADLIAGTAKTPATSDPDARKIADTYATFMDEAAIEAKGLAPLKPAFDRIAAIADKAGLATVLGETLRADVDVLNNTNLYTPNVLGLWVAQDLDTPSRYAPFLLQGGLGIPDRDYYLDPSPRMAEIRTKYIAHITSMLTLAGIPDPAATAARIFGLETKIASSHVSREDSEDVVKGNNHWAREDFPVKAPGLDWARYFEAAGLAAQPSFVAWQPGAVTGLAALVASEPLGTWKDYLTFRALSQVGVALPKAFVDERFAFYGTTLTGAQKLRDRWKRAVSVTDAALGEAVGRLYVAKYFPPSEKARAETMVKNEIAAFAIRIDKLDWMAPETKARAKAKLAALKVGVGYPDRWRDYSALEVVKGDAFGNVQRASLFEYRRNLAKLGKPVDRGEWVMNPHLVNAVNLPAMNALNFPAAMLQPPFFDAAPPGRHGLRRVGRGDRARDQPQLRRPGRALRRGGPAEELVDEVGLRPLHGLGRRSSSSTTSTAVPGPRRERQAHRQREHRGRRRARGRVRRVPDFAGRQGSARVARRPGRPAVLHRVRAELAGQDPRGGGAPADRHRRPRARRVPVGHRAERRCLVRRRSA
jgi:putative endopeptidase